MKEKGFIVTGDDLDKESGNHSQREYFTAAAV
jgi:hypothetical protein